MSDPIVRPLFFEGEVLPAADLNLVIDRARAEDARDRRYLNTPGIAFGLDLTGKEKEDAGGKKYQVVTLSAGMAIDATGRQVVLAGVTQLDPTLFDEQKVKVNDPDAWYPVFLRGIDTPGPQPALSPGSCASSEPTRTAESAVLSFGRPGDEVGYEQRDPLDVTEGPGGSDNVPGTPILVGFVQWNGTNNFKAVSTKPQSIGPRYAGVQADEVVARSGTLNLRSAPIGKANTPAVVMDQANGGELRFGLQNKEGVVTPVFTVNAKGDVKIEGTLASKLAPGTYVAESGVISDGLLVPLPKGITEKQVTDGQVQLHVHVSPRFRPRDASLSANFVLLPIECRAEGRRVICRERWQDFTAPPTAPVFRVGVCDYVVHAYVPPAKGASS